MYSSSFLAPIQLIIIKQIIGLEGKPNGVFGAKLIYISTNKRL